MRRLESAKRDRKSPSSLIPMRIAFLTPEYPSEVPDAGGLATYVQRMAQLLREFGHEPEVFVTTKNESATISDKGVPVHRVGLDRLPRTLRLGFRASRRLVSSFTMNYSMELMLRSYGLARALELRHASAPFDLVQSSNYQVPGLFIRARPGRVHAVRCSWAAELCNKIEQNDSSLDSFLSYVERFIMRKADVAYAPSKYVADYFQRTHSMRVHIIRPPVHSPGSENLTLPFALPSRYFIHFGLLRELKGTAVLAKALPLAWKVAPDLTMVWSGRCPDQSKLQRWRSLWGDRMKQVQITGPLPRSQLFAVLKRADTAVLPSLVDNLPNTVIESLSLGIPVLGSRGASIDELVEEGKTGHLVELGDVHALAETLVKMWLKKSPVAKGFKWQAEISRELKPEQAVANLVNLCKRQIH